MVPFCCTRSYILVAIIFLISTAHAAAQVPVRVQPRAAGVQIKQVNRQRAPGETQAPVQLTQREMQRLDQLLGFWEKKSSAVRTYQCQFERIEYDHVFGPKDPKTAKTVSKGEIRYAAPDKGMFRVDTIGQFTPPSKPGAQPTYPQKKVVHSEHWICDGQSIFEYNERKKQLIESRLPPHLHGKAITDGPLPFLFGAEAAKLKSRYWMQELRPREGVKDQYWLQAFPKTQQDAANFKRVRLILDKELFLPVAMELFPPNYDARRNPSRTVYLFENRRVNDTIHKVQGFMNAFVRPTLPSGWQRVTENFGQPPADVAGRDSAVPPGTRSAQRPTNTKSR